MTFWLRKTADILLAIALLGMFLWAATAKAWQPLPSTPDVSVSASATSAIAIVGRRAGYIFLQNDCSSDVYFDLREARDATDNRYPLRLAQDKQFSAEINLAGSIGVSPSAGASACTITVIFGN